MIHPSGRVWICTLVQSPGSLSNFSEGLDLTHRAREDPPVWPHWTPGGATATCTILVNPKTQGKAMTPFFKAHHDSGLGRTPKMPDNLTIIDVPGGLQGARGPEPGGGQHPSLLTYFLLPSLSLAFLVRSME